MRFTHSYHFFSGLQAAFGEKVSNLADRITVETFKHYDLNKDGLLPKAEFLRHLASMDVNNDRALSLREYADGSDSVIIKLLGLSKEVADSWSALAFPNYDKNHDGQLAVKELTNVFDAMDDDHDGVLSLEELRNDIRRDLITILEQHTQ